MRVSPMQHKSMAGVYIARAKHPCWPARINVRMLNVATLRGNRGRRIESAGGNRFGEIWRLSDRGHKRTRTWLILMTTKNMADCKSRKMWGNRWEGEPHKQLCTMEGYFLNEWWVRSVRTKITHVHGIHSLSVWEPISLLLVEAYSIWRIYLCISSPLWFVICHTVVSSHCDLSIPFSSFQLHVVEFVSLWNMDRSRWLIGTGRCMLHSVRLSPSTHDSSFSGGW